jgi:hypothetical protein
MEQPTTPKTPTASAWLALIEDDLDGEEKLMVEVPEVPKVETTNINQWVYPFCNIIPSTTHCENEESIPTRRFFPTSLDTKTSMTGISDENSKSAENQSFIQRVQYYYDNLQATTFSKITKMEEEISDHIDKVESPCKMMNQIVTNIKS